jgi:TolB protein
MLLVACGGGAADRESFSERGGDVVFTRWVDVAARSGERPSSPPSLYLIASDGSNPRVLVRNGADPSVSPDGRRLAFVRDGAIWVMRRDGSGQRPLTSPDVGSTEKRFPGSNATVDNGPAWSPDGRTVYFSRLDWETTTESIFSVHADGTGLRRLTKASPNTGIAGHGEAHFDPAPAPNGHVVAYSHTLDWGHANDTQIYGMTASGKPRSLPFAFPTGADGLDVLASGAAWSPDGRRLAYTVIDTSELGVDLGQPVTGLYISAAEGSKPRQLAAPKDCWSPAWSPDGRSIAFVGEADDDGDIWLVGADGSGLLPLTMTEADDRDPAWLPPTAR